MVLLVVHGLAGVIWMPASQVLIHRIVGVGTIAERGANLSRPAATWPFWSGPPSAPACCWCSVRPTAFSSMRSSMLPLFVWLIKAPYGSRAQRARRAPHGSQRLRRYLVDHAGGCEAIRCCSSMTVLVGASAFFVGNAYQAQMPGFALDLGHGARGFLVQRRCWRPMRPADWPAGLILESRGLLPPKVAHRLHPGDDLVLRACSVSPDRIATRVAITLLFVAGFVELEFQFDGAIPGAAECAGRDSRARDRGIFDVRNGIAHLQRVERRPARAPSSAFTIR